jgi:hypothetical protein
METGKKGALTPEQMSQLQNFNTVPATSENKQVVPPPAKQHQGSKISRPGISGKRERVVNRNQQQQQPVQQQPVQQQPVVATSLEEEINQNENRKIFDTYYKYADDGTSIELDLVTYREKGEEVRYLAINALGFDYDNPDSAPQKAFLTLSTKEAFESFKEFVSQLNWED